MLPFPESLGRWAASDEEALRACAVCSAEPTGQLCRFSAHSVGFRRPQSCHVPIERKALTAAMTNPYTPLWVSAKVPSLGSGASPFCGRFLVPPPHTHTPATSIDQIFESKPFMSTRFSARGQVPISEPRWPDPAGVLHQKNQSQTDPCCSLLSAQGIPAPHF